MPFRKWSVEPVFLCRNSSKIGSCPGFELETVVNLSLVKCLQQLSSVVKVADRIFDDVGSECRIVFNRIEQLRIKISTCKEAVSKLDARAVHVPVSDLCTAKKILRQKKPYKTVYPQQTQLFLPSNRPPCIDRLYSDACASPVSVICTVDKYRTDGRTSSQLFMVTPVLDDARRKKKRKMLDIETRKPANFSLAREDQEDLKIGGDSADGLGPSTSAIEETTSWMDRLPSPEEQSLAVSLEYPSTLVPVDISGSSFLRMSMCRRSLIHADFVIKRRKSKGKQKRRHTVCEGTSNRDLEKALDNITMVNSSCQTDDLVPESAPSTFFRRSFIRRRAKSMEGVRRETVALDGLNLEFGKKDPSSSQSSQQDGINGTAKRSNQATNKKSGKLSLMTRAANPILSLSSALSNAVRMRHSKSKQDDGRSSSGNWSASSSTRASVDSDQHHAAMAIDRNSNLSRSSAGKDSLLSDATQQESVRSQETAAAATGPVPTLESLSGKARALRNTHPWEFDRGRESSTSTPERSSDCASTPLVISPYIGRRNRFNFYGTSSLDDGESSVYSVDTDGYYTSMHTDSGLWNGLGFLKSGDFRGRHRRESQSSISTIGNGSVNSILSRTVTENSSENGSFKTQKFAPEPPPRSSSNDQGQQRSCSQVELSEVAQESIAKTADLGFEKDSSPLRNGSASESDYETGDRIRCKTTINSSRYPSMCAVSPETSDDELSELRREKSKSPTVSVVVAEVHRADDSAIQNKSESERFHKATHDVVPRSPATQIDMYGSNSPSKSIFNSSLMGSEQMSTSTPKRKSSVSSFSSDFRSSPIRKDSSLTAVQEEECAVKSPAPSRMPFARFREMTAVSIPSVPDIRVLPESPTQTPKSVPQNNVPEQRSSQIEKTEIAKTATPQGTATPPTKSKSFLKNPLISLPFRQSDTNLSKTQKISPPSYISFQSPDSPVSSSTILSADNTPCSLSALPVVTVDQCSKMAFSSHSLDRSKSYTCGSSDLNSYSAAKYATIPRYQPPAPDSDSKPADCAGRISSEKIQCSSAASKSSLDSTPAVTVNCSKDQSVQQQRSQNVFFRPSRGGRFCRTYFPSHLISSASKQDAPSNSTAAKTETPPPCVSSDTANINEVGLPPPSPNSYPHPPRITRTLFPSNYSTSPVTKSGSAANTVRNSPVQFTSSPALPGKWSSIRGGDAIGTSNSTVHVPAAYKFHPVTQKSPSQSLPVSRHQPSLSVSTPTTCKILNNVTDRDVVSRMSSADRGAYHDAKGSSRPFQSEFTPPNPPDVIPSSSTPPSTLDITSRTGSREPERSTMVAPSTPPFADPRKLKQLSPNELFTIIHNSKKRHNIRTESEKSLSPLSSRSSSPSVSSISSPSKSPRVETGVLARRSDSPSSLSGGSVNDRFGRSKPTSMHDFKMLLLQARAGSQDSNSRLSAAELLKVSPTKPLAVNQPANPRVTNSPTWTKGRLPPPQANLGQSPVYANPPVKRSMRTRSPYLTRYDSAYPPIWEDCSEELEDAPDENQNPVAAKTLLSNSSASAHTGSRYHCPVINQTVLDNGRSARTSTWV